MPLSKITKFCCEPQLDQGLTQYFDYEALFYCTLLDIALPYVVFWAPQNPIIINLTSTITLAQRMVS